MDPCRSELHTQPELLKRYIEALERAFGHGIRVVGILEIGSFAKHEAVDTSDIDTRLFVTSDEGYIFNVFPGMPVEPALYDDFCAASPPLPRLDFHWRRFNAPVSDEISNLLPRSVEFAFIDQRYAAYELDRLDQYASPEHALLFQSSILYDPLGFLAERRAALQGKIFAPLARYYTEQHLDRLWFRIYQGLTFSEDDLFKLRKSGQILWVQMAVRCLRNAAAAKTYLATGSFIYQKADILRYYAENLPVHYPLVAQLYQWKTDPAVRARMLRDFLADPGAFYPHFRELTAQIEIVVRDVKEQQVQQA